MSSPTSIGRPASLPADGPPPFVSVIMPVLDEAQQIEAALQSLLEGDHPADRFEILVIDGGSRDGTRALVRRMAEGLPEGRLRLLDNPDRVTPAGLNRGIAAARGEVILRMDGHARPSPDYLSACVAALRRSGAWVVGGAMLGRGETAFGRAVARATAHPLGAGDAAFRLGGSGEVDSVYLGAWPRAVLEALGGFDPDLPRNQDYELCLRIRAAGGRVWLDRAIRSSTLTRGDPAALARQYFGYGMGRAATLRRHPRSLRWRQTLPALWGAGLILGPPAAWAWPILRPVYGLSLAGYALLVTLVSLRLARGMAWRDAAGLPWAFAILHLAWGCGFWIGLLREVPRWRRPSRPGLEGPSDR